MNGNRLCNSPTGDIYGHDLIQAYCGDGAALGMQIQYSVEEKPLGTAGALQQARRFLNEAFLVVNGDTYFGADLSALLANHRAGGAPATLALVKVPQTGPAKSAGRSTSRFGAVTLDAHGYVTHFAEKKRRSAGLINAGIYIFEPGIWAHFPARVPLSLEDDIFPSLAAQRLLRGKVLEGYHMDIGTPESYAQFQKDVAATASRHLGTPPLGLRPPGRTAPCGLDRVGEVELHLVEDR